MLYTKQFFSWLFSTQGIPGWSDSAVMSGATRNPVSGACLAQLEKLKMGFQKSGKSLSYEFTIPATKRLNLRISQSWRKAVFQPPIRQGLCSLEGWFVLTDGFRTPDEMALLKNSFCIGAATGSGCCCCSCCSCCSSCCCCCCGRRRHCRCCCYGPPDIVLQRSLWDAEVFCTWSANKSFVWKAAFL